MLQSGTVALHAGLPRFSASDRGNGFLKPNDRVTLMSDDQAYTPPDVWTWDKENGGTFASTNRPIAGSTHEKALPVGRHPFQLYSLATR